MDDYLRSFDDYNPWAEVRVVEGKGRCVYSKTKIPRGTVLFKNTPFAAQVDQLYKRNICNTCFKFFSESNRQNVIKCPCCLEIYYCSNYCKLFNQAYTKHTDVECRWMQIFSTIYKNQFQEEDRNLLLLALKIISRKLVYSESIHFNNENNQSNNIPLDVIDLVDHYDEYIFNSKSNSNSNSNSSNDNNDNCTSIECNSIIESTSSQINCNNSSKEVDKEYRVRWNNQLKRLINIVKTIQNIIDNNKYKEMKFHGIDQDGDFNMEDNDTDSDDLDKLVSTLTPSDINILRLLTKIRANYFGLWHYGYRENLINYSSSDSSNNLNNSNGSDSGDDQDKQDSNLSKPNELIWCGSGVYLILSLFNHSCSPNCTTILEYNNHNSNSNTSYDSHNIKNPLDISIIALRDIEPNTELLITYIPLDQLRAERVKQLKTTWLFTCDCKRCAMELEKGPSFTEPLFLKSCCPKKACGNGLLVPTSNDPSIGDCRVCKNSYNLPNEYI